jgi:hypothetical protein
LPVLRESSAKIVPRFTLKFNTKNKVNPFVRALQFNSGLPKFFALNAKRPDFSGPNYFFIFKIKN